MSQQINLLPPRTRDVIAPAGIAVLVVLAVFAAAYIRSATNEVGRASDSLAQAQQKLAQVKASLAQLQPSGRAETRAQLEADIANLRPRANAANDFLVQVDSGALGKTGGYPAHLHALSDVADENVWLTRVTIGRGGTTMTVSGSATSNDAVLRYAHRLSEQFRNVGVKFRSLEIRAPQSGTTSAGAVTFTLS